MMAKRTRSRSTSRGTSRRSTRRRRRSGDGEHWIQRSIKRPGALHRALGIPLDQKIPLDRLQKAAKAPGRLGRQAREALTLRRLNKKKS